MFVIFLLMADHASRGRDSRGGRATHGGRGRGRGGRQTSTHLLSPSDQVQASVVGSRALQPGDNPSSSIASTSSSTVEGTRASPSTVAATTATKVSFAQHNDAVPGEPGTRDPTNGRIWLRPGAKLDFNPPDGPQKQISKCIKGKYNEPWPTWKKIDKTVRDIWFKEDFGAHYKWLSADENEIRRAFESRGSKMVKNAFNKIREGKDNGHWLRPDVLQSLQEYWARDEEFQKRSTIGKQNRAADVGACLYTGGSVSIPEHFNRMKKEKQREPTAYEVVERTKKTKHGEWVSPKARDFADEFHRLRDEATSQGQEHVVASDNALFLEVVGGKNKKGHVYGLGQLGDEFVASSTPCGQSGPDPTPNVREVIANLTVELAKKDNDIRELRHQVQQQDSRMQEQDSRLQELYRYLGFQPSGSSASRQEHADGTLRLSDDAAADDDVDSPLPSPPRHID